ncbi:MAG: hypothetical protein ACOX6U_01160 [Oscillospiraceae bacterium]|jgi:hypothetical protein
MLNCAEYREDLNQIRASEAFLVRTANQMLAQKTGTGRRNPVWRRRAVGSAALLTAGAGCLAVLINLPPQAAPEMDQSSKNSIVLSGDGSAWPEIDMDMDTTELPEGSQAFHPWEDIYLVSLVQIAPALIDYVGQDAYGAWAKRVSDEKTIYTENGDGSGTASYDVSVLNEDGSVRYGFLDQSVAAFLREFDISQETFAALVPMAESETDEYYSLRSRYRCAYTDEQVDALYSGERGKLLQAFAGTYTLYQNGELYPIYWFERHTAEEYRAAGFTAEQLAEAFTAWGMAIPGNSSPDAAFMEEYRPEAVVEQYSRLLALEEE